MAHINLTFGTDAGRNRALRINHADTTLTDATVKSVMDRMISTALLVSASVGSAATRRRAQLIEQSVTKIVLS